MARRVRLLSAPTQTGVDELERVLDASPGFASAPAELAVSAVSSGGASATAPRLSPTDERFGAVPTRSSSVFSSSATVPPARRFSNWSRRYVNALGLADALVGAAAVLIPARFSTNLTEGWLAPYLIPLTLVAAAIWPLTIFMMRGYNRATIGVGSDEPRAVLRAGVALVVTAAFPAGWFHNQTLLTLLVVAVPFAVLLSIGGRLAARKLLHHRQRNGENVRHVVVVGSAADARELCTQLSREPHCGMRVIGVCLPSGELAQLTDIGAPILGDLTAVRQVVTRLGADAIAVTSDDATRYNYLRELSWSLEGTGVEVLVDPGLVEVAGPRMHIRPLLGVPLLHVEEPHFTGWRRVLKRGADIVLTAAGLIVIAPLLLVVALAIKFQDGGPVLFKQTRIGRAGQPFTMFKFRSMVIDAEARKAALMARNKGKGGLFKLDQDPRITRLGKFLRDFSIDELPQLLNVLNGTMSLVGPRPHLAEELALMPSHAARRSLVTPGLTGLWQVSGRSDLEGDDAVRLDLRYVENWSLTLDLLIMWKTGFAVLAKRGAK